MLTGHLFQRDGAAFTKIQFLKVLRQGITKWLCNSKTCTLLIVLRYKVDS